MQGFGLHPGIPLACFKLLADRFINCNIWVNRNWLKWSVLKFSSHCCRWHLDIYTRLWRYACLLRGPSQPSPAVPCRSQRASGAPNTLVWPLVARRWLFFSKTASPILVPSPGCVSAASWLQPHVLSFCLESAVVCCGCFPGEVGSSRITGSPLKIKEVPHAFGLFKQKWACSPDLSEDMSFGAHLRGCMCSPIHRYNGQ